MDANSVGVPRIPAPRSISEPAQKFVNIATPGMDRYPELHDAGAWRQIFDAADCATREMAERRLPPDEKLLHKRVDIDGVPTYVLTPAGLTEDENAPLFLDFHGGALAMASGDLSWKLFAPNAAERDGVTWTPDYRNPPEYPYPAALDDCLTVYREALKVCEPERIILSGGSAGGNLASAVLLRAQDEKLPMPAGLVLLSPELDLTESGDSFRVAGDLGYMGSHMGINQLYANGAGLADPYLSPLFGDVCNFPPTFLQSGTRDIFLSNTVRMHRKLLAAGVETELHVFEAMPHGFGWDYAPEDLDMRDSQRRFERKHLGLTAHPIQSVFQE